MPATKPTRRRARAVPHEVDPTLDTAGILDLVKAHDKLLYGYPDREKQIVVRGLKERMDDQEKKIDSVGTKLDELKEQATKDLQEVKDGIAPVVPVARFIRKWGPWTVASVIVLLLLIISKQWGILEFFIARVAGGAL